MYFARLDTIDGLIGNCFYNYFRNCFLCNLGRCCNHCNQCLIIGRKYFFLSLCLYFRLLPLPYELCGYYCHYFLKYFGFCNYKFPCGSVSFVELQKCQYLYGRIDAWFCKRVGFISYISLLYLLGFLHDSTDSYLIEFYELIRKLVFSFCQWIWCLYGQFCLVFFDSLFSDKSKTYFWIWTFHFWKFFFVFFFCSFFHILLFHQ